MKNYLSKIILLVIALFLFACKERVLHDLSETEANRLIARLHKVGVEAEKVKQADGRWAISVNEDEELKAMQYLDVLRFERKDSVKARAGGFITSREDQIFNLERAISRELEETVLGIKGVVDARVHLNLPRTDPILGVIDNEGQNLSGSVLLVVDQSFSTNPEDIKRLVGGASGVPAKNISVLVSPVESEGVTEDVKGKDRLPAVAKKETAFKPQTNSVASSVNLLTRKKNTFYFPYSSFSFKRLSIYSVAMFLLIAGLYLLKVHFINLSKQNT
ncbi:MAG: hypothetical protein D6780_02155, partial [Candidatus Dadabacteria bacterium]